MRNHEYFRNTFKLHLEIFGKIILKTLLFRKDTDFPIAPLRMHFQISKSALDSLKSVFMGS